MSTAAQLLAKTARLGPAIEQGEQRGVRAAALETTTLVRSRIREAAPSGQLRMNGKPRRVGASFKMLTGAGGRARARISAEGPLHLIERDTQAHYLPRAAQSSLLSYSTSRKTKRVTGVKQRARRGRAGQGKTLKIPGIGYRKVVLHPGTKGKHPFERGIDEARLQVGRTVLREVAGAIEAVLR